MRILPGKSGCDGYGDSEVEDFDFGESSWDEEIDSPRDIENEATRRQLEYKIIALANDKVSLISVLEKYNIQFEIKFSTNGWTHCCPCPFKDHNDKSPSFGYNSTDDRFYCFGCNRSGRAVQFISNMEDRQPIDIAKDLIRNFGDSSEEVIKSRQIDTAELERIMFGFADYIRAFREKHNDNKVAAKYVDDVAWGLDLYIEKNAIGGVLNIDQMRLIVDRLKEQLDNFEV
jgi:DNA primase